MKRSFSRLCAVLSAVSLLLSGCSQPEGTPSSDTPAPVSGEAVLASAILLEEDFLTEYDTSATLIALDGESAEITGNGAAVSPGLITITSAGTYVLSGSFNGQLLIDADKKDLIHLILNGVSIECDYSAAIYGSQSKKIVITLAENTVNSLSDGISYVYENAEDDEPNAALFSKDDITLNGDGTLLVSGNYADGIRSKDMLLIISGSYEINAASDGIQGKDAVYIAEGSYIINAGNDAIKSSNSTDSEKGFVTIDGGSFEITCGDDAIHAETALTINNGKFQINACYEGLEGMTVEINDGGIYIVSEDDGINAAGGSSDAADGNRPNAPADFGGRGRQDFGGQGGFDGNELPDFDSRDFDRQDFGRDSDRFGDGERPDFGGDSDRFGDGERPDFGGGFGGGSFDGGFGGGSFGGDMDGNENAWITINGGTIYVNAGGDGIDSNGYFYMNGGTVYVEGSQNNGNAALDYAYDAMISGGTFLAIGASGMAMGFGENSSQQSLFLRLREWQDADTEITLLSGDKVLFTYISQKGFDSVVLSLPDLEKGITYTLTCGNITEEVSVSQNRTGR